MSWKLKKKAQELVASEEGVVRKDWGGRVTIALVYPNTYAVGMSNLGFQTIYSHLNALSNVVCERGNATSHLRAALLGRSVAVGISGGELSLGRFQSILFAELDGPRPRSIDIQIMGVGPVAGN